MTPLCTLCSKAAAREDCFVRYDREERPTCRSCWEQVLLDPRRVLLEIRERSAGLPINDPSAYLI